MTWGTIAAAALRWVINAGSGPTTTPAATLAPDITTAAGAGAAVLAHVAARNLTLADAEAFANGVQQILVDLGIEPAIVLEASKLLEAVAPVFVSAWTSGIITGGDPAFPAGGGPDVYHER